jgi:hypothetical protein
MCKRDRLNGLFSGGYAWRICLRCRGYWPNTRQCASCRIAQTCRFRIDGLADRGNRLQHSSHTLVESAMFASALTKKVLLQPVMATWALAKKRGLSDQKSYGARNKRLLSSSPTFVSSTASRTNSTRA